MRCGTSNLARKKDTCLSNCHLIRRLQILKSRLLPCIEAIERGLSGEDYFKKTGIFPETEISLFLTSLRNDTFSLLFSSVFLYTLPISICRRYISILVWIREREGEKKAGRDSMVKASNTCSAQPEEDWPTRCHLLKLE